MGQAVTLFDAFSGVLSSRWVFDEETRRYGARSGDLQTTRRDDAGIDRGGVGTRNRVAILVYGAVC